MIWKWIWYTLLGGKPKVEKIKYKTYPSYMSSHFDYLIFEEVNNWRKVKGLSKLEMDNSRVLDICSNHSLWMLENIKDAEDFKRRAHFFLQDRINQIQLDYPAADVGENLARGYISTANMVNLWDKSPAHYEIMAGDFTHIAITMIGQYVTTIYTKR